MDVAVVLVAFTRLTRMGKIEPAGTAVKVTSPPPAIVTTRLPAPPTYKARELKAKSVESLGVTAVALSAGLVNPSTNPLCWSGIS
jgi:hypothetical protein